MSEWTGEAEELIHNLEMEIPLCKHCVKNDMEWSVCGKEKKFEDFATED